MTRNRRGKQYKEKDGNALGGKGRKNNKWLSKEILKKILRRLQMKRQKITKKDWTKERIITPLFGLR